ncbi:MAG TPA: sugar-binding protein [Planctomycetota bacterium]|nr:sugar-binding protein [Planctomycetota bacterium]HRR78916.1 sugar-binding protein [Planctomycetota bacterium]HRT92806.1 sugar-binding protein [Planctomycetota bacterium]
MLKAKAAVVAFVLLSSVWFAAAGTVSLVLEDYEGPAVPRRGGEGVQPQSRIALSKSEPFEGAQCAELHYVFKPQGGLQYVEVVTPHRLPKAARALRVAVRGDGSGQFVRVRLTDARGEWHQFDLGRVDFQGWKVLSTRLDGPHGAWGGDGNKAMDPPVTFQCVLLDSIVKPAEGTVAFDAVTVEGEGTAGDFVESRFEPSRPHGYFWGKDERPAGALTLTAGVAQPAEAEVTVRLLNHREEPVREVWKGKVQVERGKPVQRELTLGVERYGVHYVEVQAGEQSQRHSVCWLPEAAPTWPESPFGVCTHFGQHKHTIPLTFDLIKPMGATWIRDEISWAGVERKKGEHTFGEYFDRYMAAAGEMGLRPFIIFDYGNGLYDGGNAPVSPEAVNAFVAYCKALMARYGKVCQHWEVWNEPNIFFWKPKPKVEDYAALMKAVYPATKAADPQATIVGVCTAGTDLRFIEGVLAAGAGKAMDAISVHPYRYPRSPEESDFLGEMARLKALLERHGVGDLKVWLTEFGYPTQKDKRGVSEARSGAYLVRTCLHALTLPYVERLFIYDFQNDGTDPLDNESNFGLIRLDNTPKAAYAAHNTMVRMIGRKRFARAVDAGKDVICYEFVDGQGKVLVAWPKSQAATLSLATTSKELKLTDLMGNTSALAPVEGRITLALTEDPIFLTDYGDVAKAEPLIRIEGETVGCPGDPIALAITTPRELWAGRPRPATTRREDTPPTMVRLPQGWQSKWDGDRVTITPPLDAPLGDHALVVEAGGIGASATITLREPLIVSARPGGPNEVLLTVRNPAPKPRKWAAQFDGQPAVARETGGNGVTTDAVLASPPTIEGYGTMPARWTVTAESGWRKEVVTVSGFTPCYRMQQAAADGGLAEWAALKHCLLRLPTQVVSLENHSWSGAADLSAKLWTGWDDERFYVALAVTDDRHVQNEEAEEMWKGDSVQFAIGAKPERNEFGVALGKDGKPLAWQWAPRNGLPDGVQAAVRREGTATNYEVTIPWKLLGVEPKAEAVLRFALLVNDNDGAGRKGWAEWFQGIGFEKAPAQYGPLKLLP